MSGSLVQLVAQGVQDAYLTGNPEVSFFNQVYKRHTNFASKPVKLDVIGTVAAGNELSIRVPNKGDLLSYIWVDLGTTGKTGGSTGLINCDDNASGGAEFELWIGGQMVDRQDAFFAVQLWNKFLLDQSSKGFASVTSAVASNDVGRSAGVNSSNWLPLHFSFCDGYPLPLLALQYHEVELKIKLSSGTAPDKFNVYGQYIMLDTAERELIIGKNHEFLIEQMQKIPNSGTQVTPKFDLSLLNHPVKALMWGCPSTSGGGAFTSDDVQLYLNGTEVFGSHMPDKYFSYVQPYYHCEHGSDLMSGSAVASGSSLKMYSFAQKVNKRQPSGSCNFSRLDNAALQIQTTTNAPAGLSLYAVNYNILRIQNGMAGVAFSN